jgi:hypothetical protein
MLMSCWACGGLSSPTAPPVIQALPISAPPGPPGETGAPRIDVGERVEGALCCNNGSFAVYVLTAPSDGTLVVHLSWNRNQGHLEMYLDDTHFNNWGDLPPLVGKLPVGAGRTYRIRVVDGAPWDYGGMNVPFVLSASIK